MVTTGVSDDIPDLPGLRERWGRDLLHCPYCHGWEVRDRPLGVLGTIPGSVDHALLVRQWSDDVVFFSHTYELDEAERAALDARGIRVVHGRVAGPTRPADPARRGPLGETRRVRPAQGADRSRRDDRRVLIGVILLAAAWNVVGNLFLPGAWYVPANLAAAAALLLIARGAELSTAELGLARRDVPRGVQAGLAASLVVAVVLALAVLLPSAESFLDDEVVATDSAAMRWFRPLVRIPLGTVVVEEVLFRSVLFGLIARSRGEVAAVAATAALFGLWHVVPAWESAEGGAAAVVGAVVATVAVTTVAGVVFALLRRRSRSVVAPMLTHVATNSFAYVAVLIATSGGR